MKKKISVSLIIPAHNEEKRIGPTLQEYHSFLNLLRKKEQLAFELVVVLNGCHDNTAAVVYELQQKLDSVKILDLPRAGKGYAITQGFKYVLKQPVDFIGFVDADMATSPQEFNRLIEEVNGYDGVIASRYMEGATVIPQRPWLKRWGSKLVFEPLVKLLLGLNYKDFQCGAKLFKRHVIERVVDYLTVNHWAFDVELLSLCKEFGFSIKEIPTVWHDKALSKLNTFPSGMRMLSSVIAIRKRHLSLRT